MHVVLDAFVSFGVSFAEGMVRYRLVVKALLTIMLPHHLSCITILHT
jgi:hypothetical protein